MVLALLCIVTALSVLLLLLLCPYDDMVMNSCNQLDAASHFLLYVSTICVVMGLGFHHHSYFPEYSLAAVLDSMYALFISWMVQSFRLKRRTVLSARRELLATSKLLQQHTFPFFISYSLSLSLFLVVLLCWGLFNI